MKEFDIYSDLFERLVNAVYETYLDNPPVETNRGFISLINEVKRARSISDNLFALEREDIEQELRCHWVHLIDTYKRGEYSYSLKRYLTTMSIWKLREWVQVWAHIPRSADLHPVQEEEGLQLDLSFLLEGSPDKPLLGLSTYQRYLIYLYYVEGKSIVQISKQLDRNRRTITRHFDETMDKIKNLSQ